MEGETSVSFRMLNYLDDNLYYGKKIELQRFLLGTVTGWVCRENNEDHLICVFFYSGGFAHLIEFNMDLQKEELSVIREKKIGMYSGMVPRRVTLSQEGLLAAYFSRRIPEGSRADDHRGFYLWKIDFENWEFKYIGGAGDRILNKLKFDKRSGFINGFMGGVLGKFGMGGVGHFKYNDPVLNLEGLTFDDLKDYNLTIDIKEGYSAVAPLQEFFIQEQAK